MKLDLRDGVTQEWQAFRRCLRFTAGNSRVEKMALWVFMLLFLVGGLGLFFGKIDLSDPNAAALWTLLVAVMSGLYADSRRQEIVKLQRRKR